MFLEPLTQRHQQRIGPGLAFLARTVWRQLACTVPTWTSAHHCGPGPGCVRALWASGFWMPIPVFPFSFLPAAPSFPCRRISRLSFFPFPSSLNPRPAQHTTAKNYTRLVQQESFEHRLIRIPNRIHYVPFYSFGWLPRNANRKKKPWDAHRNPAPLPP